MKFVVLLLVVFTARASAECSCRTLSWSQCDGTPCRCNLPSDTTNVLNCEKLVPKCLLMKEEMRRRLKGARAGGKPVETAIVDNDGIYNASCNSSGEFLPKQCNNTDVCWCVNSAGVRRSDKGDKDIKCEQAETYWIRLDLTHNPLSSSINVSQIKTGMEKVLQERYQLGKDLVSDVKYDEKANLMVVDIKKKKENRTQDLSHMAYYLMKDVKETPLFADKSKFQVNIGGQNVSFSDVVIYYVDDKPPTFTMKKLTGGVIAVIVVVLLIVLAGLLMLYFVRRQQAKDSKGQVQQMSNAQN